MSKEPQEVTVKIFSSSDFAQEMERDNGFQIQSVSKSEIGHLPLALGDAVAIVTIAKAVIDIVKFIIAFFEKKKSKEQITIVLEDGEQIVIRSTDEAKRILKRLGE